MRIAPLRLTQTLCDRIVCRFGHGGLNNKQRPVGSVGVEALLGQCGNWPLTIIVA